MRPTATELGEPAASLVDQGWPRTSAPPIIPPSLVHAGVKGLMARSVPQSIFGTKVDATYPFSGKACSLDTSIRILHVRRTSSSTNTPTAGSISVESDPCRSLG
jgi:hypothetical protein